MKDILGVRHLIGATRNSLCGLKDAFLSGCAFRQEVCLGVVHFVLLFLIDISLELKLVMAALWVLMLALELVNSAVEEVVDYVSPEWNKFAKHAKDYCSAAVGLVATLIVIAWVAVVWKCM